jgi:hypothetical protein
MAEGKEIKKRLIDAEKTQVWLFNQVRKKGFLTLHYTRFTEIIKGTYTGGRAHEILETAEQILDKQKSA